MSGLRLYFFEEPTNVVKQIEKSKHKSLQQTIANISFKHRFDIKGRFGFLNVLDWTLKIKCYQIKIIHLQEHKTS